MKERTLVSFDYAVKFLLRDKSDFVILSGFLSELLCRKVEVTAILESESNKSDPESKTNRVDLKAEIDDGELAVFEFQFHQEIDFFERILYGVSKAIVEQVSSGNVYGIKKVYSINVAYYNLTAKQEYLFFGKFGGFRGVHFEDETIQFGTSDIPGVDIQPDYYLILPEMFDEHLRGRFDEWVYLLKHSAVPEGYTASGLEEAKIKLDILRMSPAEKKAYEKYMDNRESLKSVVHTAIKNGREEGLAEGLAKGTENVAKAMKETGADVNYIAKVTGLTVDDISKL
jgi:predicted transposase/invertase (TIGR01784 family)